MPATDLHLESEQTAMQGLHDYQIAAHAAAGADRPGVPLPSLELCSDLPREWPNKQVNRYARTILWRRAAERAFRGDYYGDIPGEVNHAYIADILRISEAFAAPLANLFAFVKNGHESCPFIPPKQLALYANPRFWQYGLLAFIAGCCKFNNQHRRQAAATTKTALSKQEKSCERDVDALTFMQTVVMSFVRGMEFGEQTLPTNDLFVYLPVQLLPALVVAINQQGFRKAGVEGGVGYRPRKDGAEDNPLLVAGVYCKEVVYNRYPRMPDTSWAERACTCGALDPSLGQSMSFPSVLLFKLRIEIPLWRDHVTARRPPADLPAEESETDAEDHGSTERSPRFAPPVPVGVDEPQATETEALAEEEEEVTQPTYKYAQGYGRFVIRYTRLATALGNFEQGDVQTEGAVVASWLTSGLRIAMSRVGWRLLSPRHTFTRVTGKLLVE